MVDSAQTHMASRGFTKIYLLCGLGQLWATTHVLTGARRSASSCS